MGTYKYLRELWRNPDENSDLWKQRLVLWRKQPATLRIERPTRLDRARSLGYRAKQGILIVRQRLLKGGRQKPRPAGGRRSKRQGRRKIVSKTYQQIAEERASKAFRNCEVLNSYYVARDGIYDWYEVILVDRSHPVIKSDPALKWITNPNKRGRANRGLTSSGKKSRGMMYKGTGSEKARPSVRSVWR